MSQRVVSWMDVAVGDPLYRPFASWLQLDAKHEKATKSDWRMAHDFAVKNAGRDDYLDGRPVKPRLGPITGR